MARFWRAFVISRGGLNTPNPLSVRHWSPTILLRKWSSGLLTPDWWEHVRFPNVPPGWEWLSGRAPCARESYHGPSVLEQAGSSPVVPCPTERCFCRSGSSRRGTDWRGSSRPGTRSGGCDANTSSHSRTRRSPQTWDCKCREYGVGRTRRATVICFWRSSWGYLPTRLKGVEPVYDFLLF